MNVIIFQEDREFANLLESFIIQLGYNVILNTDDLADIKAHDSEVLSEIYILEILTQNGLEGFEAFDLVSKNNKNICIFITCHGELLREHLPYKIQSFNHICRNEGNIKRELEFTLQYAKEKMLVDDLFIYRSKFNRISIKKDYIYMIEAASGNDRGISIIYHKNGIYKMRMPLKILIKSLNKDFIQCHRKYIVNKKHVMSLEIKDGKKIIHLSDNYNCPCTSRAKEVQDWLCYY